MINIVLHEPEMPANTGNIGRTCVATGVRLHLIGPLGFQINDKMLKRAGLDYWDKLDVTEYDDYKDFLAKNPGAKVYMATTKAHKIYTEVNYEEDCYIMFGKESAMEALCRIWMRFLLIFVCLEKNGQVITPV
jgi:tRNA (cytidine/uridine-2'-O-)-methyltransferase